MSFGNEKRYHSAYCRVCRKIGKVLPCYPLGDSCCPYCGSLLRARIPRAMNPKTPYRLLPDTPENRQDAEATAAEQLLLWDEVMKRVGSSEKPSG